MSELKRKGQKPGRVGRSGKKQGAVRQKRPEARVLLVDIETFPIEAYVWRLWGDQNIGLDQVKRDWSMLSWSAKWFGEDKVFYDDVRKQRDIYNDRRILESLLKLMSRATHIIWHNGSIFDRKRINARMAFHKIKPIAPYKSIDTLAISRRTFDFTSHKLAYITHLLNTKYRKYKARQYQGFSMWKGCMERDKAAYKEMQVYNELDVLSLEEAFNHIKGYDWSPMDLSVHAQRNGIACRACGGHSLQRRGKIPAKTGIKYRYQCKDCASWTFGPLIRDEKGK